MEYLRLVNYNLPGILLDDLGVDTSKASAIPSSATGRALPGVE
jgi:hypothetical protein